MSIFFEHDNSCIAVKGSDFFAAVENPEEHGLLNFAIEGMCRDPHGPVPIDDEINEAIQQWLTKTGYVIYCAKGVYYDRKG